MTDNNTEPDPAELICNLLAVMPAKWIVELYEAIHEAEHRTRYGVVEIVIADGRVVGIDMGIKRR